MAYAGVILVPVSVIFTGRRVFEQAVLAWTRPAQMSGFSKWQFPIDRLGAVWLLISAAWAICLIGRAALERRRSHRPGLGAAERESADGRSAFSAAAAF
jgi:MFS-type transporter involved in bile tolerance (Atg22 family)